MDEEYFRFRRRNRLLIESLYSVIAILIFCYFSYGLWRTIVGTVIVLMLYLVLRYYCFPKLTELMQYLNRKTARKRALKHAVVFLKPYDNIWKNLELYNYNCSVKLGSDEYQIVFKEKVAPYRRSRIVKSKDISYTEIWNMLCLNFEHDTTYQSLVDLCQISKLSIIEKYSDIIKTSSQPNKEPNLDGHTSERNFEYKMIHVEDLNETIKKVDINNCSESEIANLPGINLIMAKKIIKRRTEKGGFKSFAEFSSFLNLGTQIANKLVNILEFKDVQAYKKNQTYKERRVDF